MITQTMTTVWHAPTRGRRYFSKKAAVNAEAKAIIYKRYPIEQFEQDTGNFFDFATDEPARYGKMHRRLSLKLIKCIEAY
jgi:hypothetical protein